MHRGLGAGGGADGTESRRAGASRNGRAARHRTSLFTIPGGGIEQTKCEKIPDCKEFIVHRWNPVLRLVF